MLVADDPEVLAHFKTVALEEPEFMYYHVSAALGLQAFPKLPQVPVVVLLKDFDEGVAYYRPAFSREELDEFLVKHETPTVATMLTQRVLDEVFMMPKAPKAGVILFRSALSLDADRVDEVFHKVALRLRSDKLSFIVTDIRAEGFQQRLARYLSVGPESLPSLQIVQVDGEQKRYIHAGPIDEESIVAFIQSWQDGKAPRFFRSESVPDSKANPGPVFRVVGNSFAKDVLENELDVLVKYYGPPDEKLTQATDVFLKVAQKLVANPKLRLVEVDLTKNDIPGQASFSLPYLKMFPGKAKNASVIYEGSFKEDEIIKFVKEKSSFPVEETQ